MIALTLKAKLVAGILATSWAVIGLQQVRIHRAQDQRDQAELRYVNEQAAHDTTRAVLVSTQDSIRIFGDSIRAVTRLVVQEKIRGDALSRALKQTIAVVTTLTARITALEADSVPSTGPVVSDPGDSIRHATFAVDTTPYHATVQVSLPKPPQLGSLNLRVRLDTAKIRTRLQCEKAVNGIRAAHVLVLGPTWLAFTIDSAQVDPDACNAKLATPKGWRWPAWMVPAAFASGFVLHAVTKQ